MAERLFGTGELARYKGWDKYGVSGNTISLLFSQAKIVSESAPIIAGRRLIPESLVWLVESKLRAAGKLPVKGACHV